MSNEFGNRKYIKKQELAGRLGVTSRTIDHWMAKGLVPFRKIGRTVRFDGEEVHEHLRARSRPTVVKLVQQPGNGISSLLRQRAAEIRKEAKLCVNKAISVAGRDQRRRAAHGNALGLLPSVSPKS